MYGQGREVAGRIAIGILKFVFKTLHFSVFVIVLLLGRIIQPVAGFVTAAGLLIFLFFALTSRDEKAFMWGGAGAAFLGVAVQVGYHFVLRLLAPAGVVIVSDL